EAVAVDALDERQQRRVGRAQTQSERVAPFGFGVRLLHKQLRLAVVRDVVEVSRQVDRPDLVELMAEDEIETLDVATGAGRVCLRAVARFVDVREVDERSAADRGFAGLGRTSRRAAESADNGERSA